MMMMLLPHRHHAQQADADADEARRGFSAAAAVCDPRDDVVSVHAWLVLGGYLACLASSVFAVILIFLPPGPTNEHGALRYISEGMDSYCGYATVIMGSCSLLLLACQAVAGAHMVQHDIAVAAALIQAISWNVVLGVGDTGWTVHYVGLVVFLASQVVYHHVASNDPSYGSPLYIRATWLANLFSLVFLGLAGASIVAGDSYVALRSFAVAFEFVMMGSLVAQNVFLVHALDQFKDVRLRFERF